MLVRRQPVGELFGPERARGFEEKSLLAVGGALFKKARQRSPAGS